MIIKAPIKLEGYFRADIIKKLKRLNPQFDYPTSASWQAVKPTLEETVSREVIELELKSLELAWQRCLKLTKNGATEIHLVLHPKLYEEAKKKKPDYMAEKPIPNMELYELPKIERKERKITPKIEAKPTSQVPNIVESVEIRDYTKKSDAKKLNEQMRQFDLIPVLSPCGQLSYITKKSYEASKEENGMEKINFWRPLK